MGGRAELWEYGTYIIALDTMWIIKSVAMLFDMVPRKAFNSPQHRLGEVTDRCQSDL